MEKNLINYDTLLRITNGISASNEPEDIVVHAVESIRQAMQVKGCTLFLYNRATNRLEVAASAGLSREYLEKGPVSALESIAESLQEGPVAISDVMDDPRLQYPEAAAREGIASILSVPIVIHSRIMGALRVYTAEKCEFSLGRGQLRPGGGADHRARHRPLPRQQGTQEQHRGAQINARSQDTSRQAPHTVRGGGGLRTLTSARHRAKERARRSTASPFFSTALWETGKKQ